MGLESPQEIAHQYERQIEHFFAGSPIFDLVLLGLGDDCHTASLFPGSEALRENTRMAVANWVEKLGAFRLTMTFPVFNNASNVIFLVSGESKSEAVARVAGLMSSGESLRAVKSSLPAATCSAS